MSEAMKASRRFRTASRGDKLRWAAQLVRAVVDNLDFEGVRCEKCNAMRRNNWEEFRVFDILRRLPEKLEGVASDLDADRRRL